MNRRITLKDIARETGVHVSTVSRALDPNATTPLTDAVVERIKATAEQLGYRPNRVASGLRTNRTMTIGVLIPDITNALFPPIVRGIESVLEPLGYTSIIVNTDNNPEREGRMIDVLRERGVDGIVHAAALLSDPKIASVAAQGLPVVTLNRRIANAEIPHVINDEFTGIRLALTHLRGLGHHRIAHIAGPQNLSTGQIRLEAFQRACSDLGVERLEGLVAVASRFDEDEGARCVDELINPERRFTAILCANDRLALGAIGHLRRLGIACPKEISVTGFNDMPMLDLIPPRLTTIRIQQFEAGRTTAGLLIGMLVDPEARPARETVLPVELVVRDSTGPVRPSV